MCEVCADFQNLLELYEVRVASSDLKFQLLLKSEIETTFNYIQSWPQRQCMCLYRDTKNYDRFNLVVQSLICLTVQHLKHIDHLIDNYKRLTASAAQVVAQAQAQQQREQQRDEDSTASEEQKKEQPASPTEEIQAAGDGPAKKQPVGPCTPPPPPTPSPSQHKSHLQYTEEPWILPEVEKLLVLVSKVFLLNFPLYIAHKHGMHSRLDDLQAEEAHHLALICDLHDNDLPIYLLRNVSLFCNSGGFGAMSLCFEHPDLPVSTAHSMTAAVSNVKLWLNYHCNTQLFVPLRSRILQYMCKLSDQSLRSAATRAMADFVWSSMRDPLDVAVNFDTEGLALAFKYFTSTTLTMRLAGMAQINAHINLFNEICTTETVNEVELFGQRIANWLTENHIVQHLFGPNLHVEIVKQAHVLLNFLAVENQISEEDIKLIWQATQLKHCSKTIFDILPSLVKNLAPRPAMHLYSLLCRMDPKEHTEQSIYITSALTKLLWARDCSRSQMNLMQDHLLGSNVTASSSDSGSIEGSNTEDDHVGADDSSIASGGGGGGVGNKSPIDGVTPCKQARHRRHICDPTTEKGKQISAEDMAKVDMVNNRIVNIIDNTSSEEELQSRAALELQLHRSRKKTSNKRRRQKANKQIILPHELVEIWDGAEDVPSSDEADADGDGDGEGELLADSDECSDGATSQLVPAAVLKHLQGEGPYIRAIETNISELLSGAENDGSYSSPMSNKSEKNLADFDDEDVSPCEEELAQLVSSRANCRDVPPAFAAAAAAMMVAQSAMALQKSGESNVAAAAAAVAAAAAATGNAQQTLVAMNRQASVAAAAAVVAAAKAKSDSDVDLMEVASGGGKQHSSPKTSQGSSTSGGTPVQPSFKLNDVCQPGNTLLWDLLQDDKIGQLGESLALEAEKALATLLCFSMDRQLRTKFIEGCLYNVASNRSVIVSLRLLPKLFASFQQFRPSDTHSMTLWAERNHRMMQCFFNNIRHYARCHAEILITQNGEQQQQQLGGQLYTHKTQVSVRLQFLSSIFSTVGSPKSFRLTLEQLDALWEWLAHDPECADCYFSWLQAQAKGGDQHALGIEALQHLYLKKLPELRPEEFSMVALGLFQQLCSFARIAMAEYDKHSEQISASASAVGMYHLWKIALRAQSNDVSLAAIQYINMYYMGQQLRLEKEFVSQCMENLVQAATALESIDDDTALMRVQRGLLLLNTHLDTFRRRYAFHLRRWAIEGKGIGSHSNLKNEGAGPPLRIVLQQAGLSEKSLLQMHACDLIADLKAEVSKWWESLQTGLAAPVLGLLLSDGPLRIITQGQELTSDYDERSLGDAGFKDNQIVYVSLGGRGARRKESNLEHPSMLPPPPKECLPTVLLLQPKYFEKLFCLMQTLGDMQPQASSVNPQHHTKAQLLSRRVWDILAMLPTNPHILDAFKGLVTDLGELEQLDSVGEEEQLATKRKQIKQKFRDLLDPNNLQKFMYSLHIVESLALTSARRCESNGSVCGVPPEQIRVKKSSMGRRRNSNEQQPPPPPPDAKQGELEAPLTPTPNPGLQDAETEASSSSGGDKENQPKQHSKRQKKSSGSGGGDAFEQEKERPVGCSTPPSPAAPPPAPTAATLPHREAMERGDNKWSEAFVKCGGLRHLYEIFSGGQLQQSAHPKELALNEWRHDCLASLLRILWLLGFEELQSPDVHVLMSRPHPFMLQLMEVPECLTRLSSILNDEVHQQHQATSANPLVFPYQFQHLRTGFWGRAQLIQFAMNILVSFVHASEEARRLLWAQSDTDHCRWLQKFILEDPEPAVRREICAGLYRICLSNAHSYRLLLAPLLHKLIALLPLAEQMSSGTQPTQFLLSEEGKDPYGPACRDYFWLLARLVDTLSPEMVAEEHIDIELLCESISQSILTRDYFELRHGYQDDGLVGLLNLMSNLIKYDTSFKYTAKALSFIEQLIGFLFDMPSPADRQKPKCKSGTSRAAAYDLLVELCRGCATNYGYLHGRLLAQHKSGPKQPYPWDYWPRDEGRSECGYVGLTNLGATCYMASCVQHLYMMPQARAAVLRVPPTAARKHGPTLLELQRMFAYLLESERKSYNPRSFCRVYQMDHQPLNTGEQKDMAEFFIDLVSKLEDMTPDLKHLVKRLFCGSLSNNVVSLDCGHVSRTAEDFYTVRCQVADMRNLQESLDEVTVKDTLEGDNMYTCSQCGKKVRAEKRACFKKLPQILCFNTMRYTFNMVTMLKEKVNTHFSFPLRLNMCHYVEKTLMPQQYKEERERRQRENEGVEAAGGGDGNDNEKAEATLDADIEECYEYELVGVTVHTGTADGGHYYSFIKERTKTSYHPHERWFLFNDAEVKPFDPSQIAAECFGGEMTSKTYDSVTEKYLDFSFEKTNSAYMLFYERRLPEHLQRRHSELLVTPTPSPTVEEKSEVEEPTKMETSSGEIKAELDVEVEVENEEKKQPAKTETESKEIAVKEETTAESKAEEDEPEKKITALEEGEKNPETTDEKAAEKTIEIREEMEKPPTANCDNHKPSNNSHNKASSDQQPSTSKAAQKLQLFRPLLNKELEDWIWQDNRQFLQDRNIFEHTYFNFMWQICGHIPQSLISETDVTCMAAKLSVSFFIETFIHAKEKPTMVPWVELLTKQFNASQEACEWFLSHMSLEPYWPVQVLIQCPNQMVRQMFQRLVIHVIQQLRPSHADLYLDVETDEDDKELIGQASCVTRFIGSLISLLEQGARSNLRHLSEYFGLLCEFSRMGDEEAMYLLRIGILKSLVDFYLGHKQTDSIDISSDNEDNSSDEALSVEKMRPASLDKMIALCASLVERSRGPDFRLRLSPKDFTAIAGGKGFPFLYQQIKDGINPHQTKHLIHALCRWDERLATQIIGMLFASVTKHTELCAPFFKLLTLLTETQGGPVGLPCFTQLILPRMWDAAEYCPQSVLDWLSLQATKNKIAHAWILQSADQWLEQFLLAHDNTRVRNAAAFLLVALVPSQPFRANFRAHSQHKLLALNPHSYRDINSDAQAVLHQVITLLLRLLRPARVYADIGAHGTTKLTAYFNLLSYCMVSKTEKLMASSFMRSLWELFHPRLSEPSVPAHHNKHALLTFWHHSLVDCPENAAQVANCPEITRNIAFNYILADHDDAEIVTYNRSMLPAYYGLLRLCCEQSRALTRQLSQHQNLQWAFKNITPHPTQYAAAVDELFKLMALFATRHPDASEQEKLDVTQFRRAVIVSYTSSLDARVSWSTLISALKILVDNEEDRTMVIFNGGIEMCFEALHTLHSMHHEATACHVAGDLFDLLGEMLLLLATLRTRTDSPAQKKQQQQQQQLEQQLQLQQQQMLQKQQQQQQSQQSQTPQAPQTPQQKEKQLQQQMQQHLQLQQLQQMQFQQQHFLRQQHQHSALAKALPDAVKRLATLLNTFNSPEISRMALEVLKELVRNTSLETISILAPILINCHLSVANAPNAIGPLGPYFPRRGAKHTPWPLGAKNSPRPPRPMVQMCIALAELTPRGLDADYDVQVESFYRPYHDFVDVMMRMCVNTGTLNDTLVKLQCLVAIESTPLHFNYFPKFWVGIHNNALTHKYVELLVKNQLLVEYLHNVLKDERSMLKDACVREFLELYYHKVAAQLPVARMIYTINYGMHSKDDIDELCGDLFAIRIIAQATGVPASVRKELRGSLRALQNKSERFRKESERDPFPNKKLKRDSQKDKEKVEVQSEGENATSGDADKPADVSMESSGNSDPVTTDSSTKPPTPAGSDDEQMEKTSIPSSDDETELEDELEPTPKRNKKTSNKKTAQDRLNEEREKRLITLITMESYIQSIFAILKRDSSVPSGAAANKEPSEEPSCGEASTSASAAAAAGKMSRPKGACTPPEPMPEASETRCSNMETEEQSPKASQTNGSQPPIKSPPAAASGGDTAPANQPTPVPSSAVASTSQAASPTQI
ncbi:ubiquitin carboxyl-terminal hydrolase puf [Drosophila gunungcola]|uniref:ubiquitin carboxyl-terminal hydrolase puf n=1 Tax=Drosophila gunungcola TaxID=103775 RepID=UPI0022E35EA2|nr:ubiquitin carboxyl-terminal hydrolase puf [Drosophila gunungcola]XP_052835681.1 ubiquitin carboxyl-terminal hydrolase puf [Drosophila gunungcola]XP_052835682.1 ubiquitin carboxyl-terminal hydrolase puf [Drosophila gunungcola]